MCTVSFLPLTNNDFVFTSNRDEAVGRETIAPQLYYEDGVRVLCPKDKLAGGTWIGVSDKNRLVCLLNGGFEKHKRKSAYRYSRGKVVKDFLKVNCSNAELTRYDLEDIEPFTLVVVDWNNELSLTELVWDGDERHIRTLDPKKPKIWSSSTLYTNEMKQMRETWFASYFSDKIVSGKSAIDFHVNFSVGDPDVDLQIDRGMLKTVSVTNVVKNELMLAMEYRDLIGNILVRSELDLDLVYG